VPSAEKGALNLTAALARAYPRAPLYLEYSDKVPLSFGAACCAGCPAGKKAGHPAAIRFCRDAADFSTYQPVSVLKA
jgi:hypothetical protein